MPLDQLGEGYAQNLFTTRLDKLTEEHTGRITKARQDLASRGFNAGNAGFYHTTILDINLEHVEAVANAKADSLVEAYKRAGLPIDNAAISDIMGQASRWIEGQIRNVAQNSKLEIERNRQPANMVQHVDSVIGHRQPGISSRLRLKLSRLRDEQLLDARKAANDRQVAATEGMSSPAKEWSWASWWKEWRTPAVIVAIITLIAMVLVAIFPGEIRHRLGFDKPAQQATPATSPDSSQQPAANRATGSQSSSRSVVQASSSRRANVEKRPPDQKKSGNSEASGSPVQVNAPNGIVVTGGVVNNPTVNNYGPPPVTIRFAAQSTASTDPQFAYENDVTISTDGTYTPVSLAFICDSKVEKILSDFGHFGAARMNMRMSIGGENSNVGVLYFEGTPVTPERPLYVHLWASAPFHVTTVQLAKFVDTIQ